MWLRIKPNRKSGERDRSFESEYDGVKYKVGPEPVKLPDKAARYFLKSYSGFIEQVKGPM